MMYDYNSAEEVWEMLRKQGNCEGLVISLRDSEGTKRLVDSFSDYPSASELKSNILGQDDNPLLPYTPGARLRELEPDTLSVLNSKGRAIVQLCLPGEHIQGLLHIQLSVLDGRLDVVGVVARTNGRGWPAIAYQLSLVQEHYCTLLGLSKGSVTTMIHEFGG